MNLYVLLSHYPHEECKSNILNLTSSQKRTSSMSLRAEGGEVGSRGTVRTSRQYRAVSTGEQMHKPLRKI